MAERSASSCLVVKRTRGTSTMTTLSKPDRVAGSSGTSSGSIVTTSPSRVLRAATRSLATASSPGTTRTRGGPETSVEASARSFWGKVSPAASTTARKTWKPAALGVTLKTTGVVPATREVRWVSTRAPSA